jgi:hypothetical protein
MHHNNRRADEALTGQVGNAISRQMYYCTVRAFSSGRWAAPFVRCALRRQAARRRSPLAYEPSPPTFDEIGYRSRSATFNCVTGASKYNEQRGYLTDERRLRFRRPRSLPRDEEEEGIREVDIRASAATSYSIFIRRSFAV